MHGAVPEVFADIDAVGIHPYHWPHHHIWDDNFVQPASPTDGWRDASPNEFADNYVKRFDFLEQVSKAVVDPENPFGLLGKRIWVTEFGIGTKKMGEANRPVAEYVEFIKQRNEPPLSGGYESRDWEDLWDAFFSQVDRAYLEKHSIEVFIFYALRESAQRGLDRNDDDRTNFAILRLDGSPRMHMETAARLEHFLHTLT